MERTSPQEPLAIYRKCLNSLLPLRSKPSAILLITATEARFIWSLKS